MINKLLITLVLTLGSLACLSQCRTIYLIPGMGTDHRIMEGFDFGEDVNHVTLKWPENAQAKEGLSELAESIATHIDTTENFILLGVSMEGMLCIELSQLVKPEAIILVSSIESSKELPLKYKLGRIVPAHKLLSQRRLEKKANNPRTWKEIDSEAVRKLYAEMLKSCGAELLKWQMSSIVHWRFKERKIVCPIFHIHGEKDNVLPLRKTSADSVIPSATHKLIANGRDVIELEVRKFLSSMKFD